MSSSASQRLSSLEARLDSLSESHHKSTLPLINRLANFKNSTITTADAETTGSIGELTAEIHECLKREDEELEILKQEVAEATVAESNLQLRGDSERQRDQARLAVQIARLGEDFSLARTRFRTAQIQAKRNAAQARAQERRLLFTTVDVSSEDGSVPPSRRKLGDNKSRGTQHDEAVAASGDVTAALQRTLRLLQTEVQRSHFAQEVLEQSTESLKQLGAQYNDLDSLLSSSRSLIGTLVTSTKSDTWYLETTFYFLLGTILWLIFRRFLYGPLWWLAWFPLKLTFRWLLFPLLGLATSKSGAVALSSGGLGASNSIPIASMSADASKMSGEVEKKVEGLEGSVSEEIGKMAEKSKQDQHKEEIRRGDGTILENSGKPRNPKKRVMEVPPEELEKKDEL